MIYSYT